jgi:short-subunit dehydrogenase
MDYIIINAGVGYFWEFKNITENQHQEILETNLLSPICFLHKLLKQKKIKTWIIFIGSIASKKSMKFWASYMASKFWLRGFAMWLKNDYKELQIQIINPSIVKTDFHKKSTFNMSNYRENSLDSILKIVENIIIWKEKRFEVDV